MKGKRIGLTFTIDESLLLEEAAARINIAPTTYAKLLVLSGLESEGFKNQILLDKIEMLEEKSDSLEVIMYSVIGGLAHEKALSNKTNQGETKEEYQKRVTEIYKNEIERLFKSGRNIMTNINNKILEKP